MDTNNSFSVLGPYANKFVEFQSRSPAQSTRSRSRQLPPSSSSVSSTSAFAFKASTSQTQPASRNPFGLSWEARNNTLANSKVGPNLEAYYKKTNTKFGLPSQAKLEGRMDKAEERRKNKRAAVAIENRRINMKTLYTKTPLSKTVQLGNSKSQEIIIEEFSNIKLSSPPPSDGVKESRREQLLKWKQEKEQLNKVGVQKKPPFKAGPAQPTIQHPQPPPNNVKFHKSVMDSENTLMTTERRVTRAMTKGKAVPFAEVNELKKSKQNGVISAINKVNIHNLPKGKPKPITNGIHMEKSTANNNNQVEVSKINEKNISTVDPKPVNSVARTPVHSRALPRSSNITPARVTAPVGRKKLKGMKFDSVYVEYKNAFIANCSALQNYWKRWSDVLTTSREGIPEEICGDIESSLGQANLLLESKLPQFGELLYHYLSKHEDPQPVLAVDLQGWWDVAIISIDNVKNRFEKLAALEKNKWVEEQQFQAVNDIVRIESPKKRRRSSIKKNAKPNAGLLAFLAEKRRKALEEKEKSSSSPATPVAQQDKENFCVSFTMVE